MLSPTGPKGGIVFFMSGDHYTYYTLKLIVKQAKAVLLVLADWVVLGSDDKVPAIAF